MWPISASEARSNRSVVERLAGQRGGGQRCHEFLRALGQQGADARAALAQAPDQVEGLVGRDPAADDEEDAAVARGSRSCRGPLRVGAGPVKRAHAAAGTGGRLQAAETAIAAGELGQASARSSCPKSGHIRSVKWSSA